MINGLENDASSRLIVFNWVSVFKCGYIDISNVARNRRLNTNTNEEIIVSKNYIVLDNKLMIIYEIAEDVGISNERLLHILKNELKSRKLAIGTMFVNFGSKTTFGWFYKDRTDFVRR